MNCRKEKLSAVAMSFLESQGCVSGQDVNEVRRAIPEQRRLSEAQIEAIASLGGVEYTANNGYRVSFFPDCTLGRIASSVSRNAFACGQDLYLGYCDTNAILEMDDTVMCATGELKVLGGREADWKLSDSPYVVIEHDAFLEARNWPYLGHAVLHPGIERSQLQGIFHDLTLYDAASDSTNAIWYSHDIALVYYGWVHSVTLETIESCDMIHLYGRADNARQSVKERLAAISIGAD